MKLLSIAREAAACRAAWAAVPDASAGFHIHHEIVAELLYCPIEERIAYILTQKPKREQALRLRLMRPCPAPAYAKYLRVTAPAWTEYRLRAKGMPWTERARDAGWTKYQRLEVRAQAELHRSCPTPNCPWDGKSIFGKAAS